jgi:hypothetical protein
MESLKSIFQKFSCDKHGCHHLDVLYEQLFEARRQEPLNLLEIGVSGGASMRSWYEYLPHATITGIDKAPTCAERANDRTTIFIGNQSDREFIDRVVKHTGPLDIVIDDGSHKQIDQQTSFEALWPHVKRGGVYVIEDMHCGYSSKYNKAGVMLTIDWLIGKYRQTLCRTPNQPVPYWFTFYQAACAVFKAPGG